MPKPPRFKSPRVREHVISTVMVLLLGGALLCALAFSTCSPRQQRHQPMRMQHGVAHQIEHRLFTLPAGWNVETQAKNKPLGQSQLTFYNQESSLRVLDIGILPGRTMRPAAKAMEEALAQMFPGMEAQPLMQSRTRQGIASGYMQVSLFPFENSKNSNQRAEVQTRGMISHLLVFTDDGREYVVIHHYEITEYDPNIFKHNKDRLIPAIQPVLAIAQASHDTRYRQANRNDLFTTGFTSGQTPSLANNSSATPLVTGNEWQLRVSQIPADDQILQLLPSSGSPIFWIAQLRGAMLPASADNEKEGYDGQALLRYLKHEDADDDAHTTILPVKVVVNEQTIAGWKLVTQLPPQTPTTSPKAGASNGDGLVREHWYLPLSDRRVLVANLIAEPEAVKAAGEKLAQAAAWLQSRTSVTAATAADASARLSPQDAWSDAIRRGEQLVQDIRSHAGANYTTEKSYSLFQLENRPIGFTLAQDATGDEPLSLRGRQVTVILSEPRIVQEVSWSSDAELRRQWLTSRTSMNNEQLTKDDSAAPVTQPAATMKLVQSIRSELRDGVLTHYDLQAAGNQAPTTLKSPSNWSYTTPANHLPWLGMDLLSPAFLERWTGKPPALIMYSVNLDQPEPCWFEVQKFETLWRVTIRPLADALSQQFWFNPQGVCGQISWSHYYPTYGGPWRYTSAMLQRDTILNAFEQLKPEIIAWEKEWQTHEKPSE